MDSELTCQVENRHNYILWLKDLLDTTSYEERSHRRGLDIGTGASCIYPLLGCTQRPWSFIATGEIVRYSLWSIVLMTLRHRRQEYRVGREEC